MPIFFSKKLFLYLLAVGFSSIVFFLAFFSLPLFSASYCKKGVDLDRCNAKFPNRIQTCGNCDADPDYEWCNTVDCVASGKICKNGVCQTALTCVDVDNDGYGKTDSTACPKSGLDCDDANATVHPGATEICGNGLDEDCINGDLTCAVDFTISVLQPTASEILAGDLIDFIASSLGGSSPYKYVWQSDLDGNLYSGFADNFSTNKLSVGTHIISLKVTDNLGETATKTFNLTIKAADSLFAVIDTPIDGNQFPFNNPVFFNSIVSGAKEPATYVWTSDRDGIINTSGFFSISTLSLGDHKITLTVTDAAAKTVVNSINIKIIPAASMALTISSPNPGTYEQGYNIFFNAEISGGTAPYIFNWRSNKEGLVGSAASIMKNDLSLGTHRIAAIATDATGAKASQSVVLEIVKAQCFDVDNDGYGKTDSTVCPKSGLDCDDANPNINPAAAEICGNAIDENCNESLTDCLLTLTVLSPASDGQTFAWGSKLNIKIKGAPITAALVTIYDLADAPIKFVSLYNDGKHNDGAAGDDIWGTDTPLLFPDGNYYFDATIDKLLYEKIRTFNINNTPTCTTLLNNGDSADKLDIVFIADQYTSAEMLNFIAKVQAAYTYLLGLKPFDAQSAKINIHRVNSPVNLGCAGWSTGQPNCNFSNIPSIANLCPNDRTIVMVDGNFRSYAFFGGYAVVAANDGNFRGVTAHEFGHSFGLLDDEYVDGGVSDPGADRVNLSVNCDTSTTCAKWSIVAGAGCFKGCDYRGAYYRSINNGIMRDYRTTDYGIVNINQLNKLFNLYK